MMTIDPDDLARLVAAIAPLEQALAADPLLRAALYRAQDDLLQHQNRNAARAMTGQPTLPNMEA